MDGVPRHIRYPSGLDRSSNIHNIQATEHQLLVYTWRVNIPRIFSTNNTASSTTYRCVDHWYLQPRSDSISRTGTIIVSWLGWGPGIFGHLLEGSLHICLSTTTTLSINLIPGEMPLLMLIFSRLAVKHRQRTARRLASRHTDQAYAPSSLLLPSLEQVRQLSFPLVLHNSTT